jgi:type VI secretion system protein ImpL
MWIWIVAILLLALLWGGFGILHLAKMEVPLGYVLGATAIVVLTVASIFLVRKLRAIARAKALERELQKQSERQSLSIKPERREEIVELQRQMNQAIKTLQKTKLGSRFGRSALYALPWYAVIGPTGSGKTTTLKHSGLKFPVSDNRSSVTNQGAQGTLNCDWWFANEAVLLDTAGRYCVDEDHHEEWTALLDLLKKHRPRKPLNGLILTFSVIDLIQSTEDQLTASAIKLRARVDEVMSRLEMVLPVYLVLTKVDKIAGFVEIFGDLHKNDRDQVFGATLPIQSAFNQAPGALVNEEFELLADTLHARAVRTIGDERLPVSRLRVFQFPLEFKALRENLEQFVNIVFGPNAYQDSPLFRGFYFTSSTQEGRPIDRVVSTAARAFGLRGAVLMDAPKEPKSYFLTDLFRKVVFPDFRLAGATEASIRRRMKMGMAIAGALAVFGLGLLIPAAYTFSNNYKLLNDVRANAVAVGQMNWEKDAPTFAGIATLNALRDNLGTLQVWGAKTPARYRWGMYAGNTVYAPSKDVFVKAHAYHVSNPVRRDLCSTLSEVRNLNTITREQFRRYYDALKLYLMMGNPSRIDETWASPRLARAWGKAVPQAEPLEREMQGNLAYYIALVKRGNAPPWDLDDVCVGRARSDLLRVFQADILYKDLVQQAHEHIAPIKQHHVFHGSVAPFVTSYAEKYVPGEYTKEGWQLVREQLKELRTDLADESWVLGKDLSRRVEDLKEQYFSRYQKSWEEFLRSMMVRKPENATVALEELQSLTEPTWPYLRLIKTLSENTALDISDEQTFQFSALPGKLKSAAKAELAERGLIDAGVPEAKPERKKSSVELAFEPITKFAIPPEGSKDDVGEGLKQYQQSLSNLVAVLTDLKSSDSIPDASKVSAEFQQAGLGATALLTSQNAFTKTLLEPYLIRPISGAWNSVVKDAGAAAGGLWETTAYEKWRTTLSGRYPFVDAAEDAKIEDFSEFLQPENGQLWAFYRENLTGGVRHTGDLYDNIRKHGAVAGYSREFLSNCLERGAKIASFVFPSKSTVPSLVFEVNLHSVSSDVAQVQIEIDGVSQTYSNTPALWFAVEWPAKEATSRGAVLRIRGKNGLEEEIIRQGDFGLFRLLDAADKLTSGKTTTGASGMPTMIARWNLRSQGAYLELDIRASRADGLPNSAIFRGYKCPRVLAEMGI